MQWDALLLSIVGLYATVKLWLLFRSQRSLKFLGLAIAGGFFVVTQGTVIVEGFVSAQDLTIFSTSIAEWGHVLCLSFILSALAIFIRESKPVFAQFPLLYSALPLLIVVSYILVTDTYAIKQWLISIYQGGAILVAILMYSVYSYRKSEYTPMLGGMSLFLVTFILFWYTPEVRETYTWVWKLLLGISVLAFIYGLDYVYAKVKLQAGSTA